MIRLIKSDSSYEELPGAVSAQEDGDEVLLLSDSRLVVARYSKSEVLAYSRDGNLLSLAQALKAEVPST